MRDSKRLRPRVEELESMTLLSTIPVTAYPHVAPSTTQQPVSTVLALNGTAHAIYATSPAASATDTHYELGGIGKIKPLGLVALAGGFHVPTGTQAPPTTPGAGNLILVTSKGLLSLKLTQFFPPTATSSTTPAPNGFYFDFTIKSGTGAYSHDTGTGTLHVTIDPSPTTSSSGGTPTTGTMTLTFASSSTASAL